MNIILYIKSNFLDIKIIVQKIIYNVQISFIYILI